MPLIQRWGTLIMCSDTTKLHSWVEVSKEESELEQHQKLLLVVALSRIALKISSKYPPQTLLDVNENIVAWPTKSKRSTSACTVKSSMDLRQLR